MIITTLIITNIGLFLSIVLMKVSTLRRWIIGICITFFVGMLVLLIANDNYHFGLVKVHDTDTQTLVTSAPNTPNSLPNTLLYKALGTGKERVYLYRTNLSQKRPQPVPINHTTAKVTTGNFETATLVIKTTRWQYQNDWMHALFAMSGEQNTLASRHYTFQLPNTWMQLSTNEAGKLAVLLKEPKNQQLLKASVTDELTQAIKRNPDLSAENHAKLEHQATKNAIRKLLQGH